MSRDKKHRHRERNRDQTRTVRPRLLAHPLESLVFVLPLIFIYEIGRLALGRWEPGSNSSLAASALLDRFFHLFGRSTFWMPAAAVIVVLLSTHLSSGQPWQVRPRRILGLYGESMAWAIPLLLLDRFVRWSTTSPLLSGLGQELALSLGAAVYEEFVFRLALMALVYLLCVDMMRGSATLATAIGVIASALLFAAHHHPPLGLERFEVSPFVFRTLAGAYLAIVFVWRGFALAVGAHAGYNILVVMLGG